MKASYVSTGSVAAPKFLEDVIAQYSAPDHLTATMRDAYATHRALVNYITSGEVPENKRGWIAIPVNVTGYNIYLKDVTPGGIHLQATPNRKIAPPGASAFQVKITPDGIYSCYRELLPVDDDTKKHRGYREKELLLLAGPLKAWFEENKDKYKAPC